MLHILRERLENSERTLHYATLGIISGLLVGAVILGFRILFELPQYALLPSGILDDYESLSLWQPFALPFGSGILLGLALWLSGDHKTSTGLVHVVDRVHNHHSVMSMRNAIVQFLGGAIAIAGGQSAGREGPAVHLGAAVNSWLCRVFRLPHNSLRILVGSGIAAAIAASFNTPIAGVIFAMEVVLMEYSVAGFIPVIAAAVTGTIITHTTFGAAPALNVVDQNLVSLLELPLMALLGAAGGLLAGAFIWLQKKAARRRSLHVLLRMTLAGGVTGLIGMIVPEVLGLGYDSIQAAMLGQMGLFALVTLIASKLICTTVSCGLGMPIGFIGPSFVIGACLGAFFGTCANLISPELTSPIGFYALLGIACSMGAILNAPLAAIIAIIELTQNPHLILPVMLTVITANVINNDILKQSSLVSAMLAITGSKYQLSPTRNLLQRLVVGSRMDRKIATLPEKLSLDTLHALANEDINFFAYKHDHQWFAFERNSIKQDLDSLNEISCTELSQSPQRCFAINHQATLLEAHQSLRENNCDALLVFRPGRPQPIGLISRKILNFVIDMD